jgi:hypothetical protein
MGTRPLPDFLCEPPCGVLHGDIKEPAPDRTVHPRLGLC